MNRKLLKFIGFLAILIPVAGILLSMAIKTDFAIHTNVLSDLGADSRTEIIFNYSLVIGGILSSIYFASKGSIVQDSKTSRNFFLLGSLGLAMLGLFPVYDASSWYFQRVMHWLGGLFFFLGFPLGMLTLGSKEQRTSFGKFSLYYGVITFIVPLVLLFNNNMGVLQFSVVALIINWVFLFAVRVFRVKSIV